MAQEERVTPDQNSLSGKENERNDSTASDLKGLETPQEEGSKRQLQDPESTIEDPEKNDPIIISWDSPDDPENPKNWSFRRKWAALFIISCFSFISPCSSSMVAPGIEQISRDLNIQSSVEGQMTMSIFVFAYAVGPLILGPLSEIYGRVPVLQLANLVYLAFDIACGASQSSGQLIAFRFLSGFGGSAPLSISGGVVSDLFTADKRGRAVALYALMPLLGPAVGPIAGGFISEYSTWRWSFYATAIADGVVQILGLFFLQETYAPVLLLRKKRRFQRLRGQNCLHLSNSSSRFFSFKSWFGLKKPRCSLCSCSDSDTVNNNNSDFNQNNIVESNRKSTSQNKNVLTEYEFHDPSSRSLRTLWARSLYRPFRMLATQPIIQILSVYRAYLNGLTYLMLSTLPMLFRDVYHQSEGSSGLQYLSIAIGMLLGTQIGTPLLDKVYQRLNARGIQPGSMLRLGDLFGVGDGSTGCEVASDVDVEKQVAVNPPSSSAEKYHSADDGKSNDSKTQINTLPNSQAQPRTDDSKPRGHKTKINVVPEYRLPLMVPCSLIIPIGLLWYGWSASASPPLHWIMPDIGIVILAVGICVTNQCLAAYLIDSYQRYAASANGSVTFLRSMAGFSFPLFAPHMYEVLGYGKGCTVLACAAVGIGIPAPVMLWFWGKQIRARSRFAAG